MPSAARRSPANFEKQDVYWMRDKRQLEALVSSRRQDIGDHLSACGPLSAKEIACALGMKPSALYHHLEQLMDVGLIVEVGHRIVNRRTEKLYDTPARKMRWGSLSRTLKISTYGAV